MTESLEQVLDRLRGASQARVLLVSDSHGRLDGIEQLIQQQERPDLILHCGDHQDPIAEISWAFDLPVLGVAGNCDHSSPLDALPQERLVVLAGQRIFLTHGHLFGVKHQLNGLVQTACSPRIRADVACFGHTHHQLAHDLTHDQHHLLLLNPGSSYPARLGAQGAYLWLFPGKIEYQLLLDAKIP